MAEALSLYITNSLTVEQWYCLCIEASKHHVALKLAFAPGVALPEGLKFKLEAGPVEAVAATESEPLSLKKANITNNANHFLKSQGLADTIIVDIDDNTYQTLFYRIEYTKTRANFTDFKIIKSELLLRLECGEDVVLKGLFTAPMLNYLHPFVLGGLIDVGGEQIEIKGNLCLIIEESIDRNFSARDELQLLNESDVAVVNYDAQEKIKPTLFDEKMSEAVMEDSGAEDFDVCASVY